MENSALLLAATRYGQPVDFDLPKIDATLETLLNHRSVRSFLEMPLPPATLELLVTAAQSAPTSSNLQMWSVIAVEDGARKARLADYAAQQRHIKQAPLLLVFLADMAILNDTAAAQKAPLGGIDYLDTFLMAAIDAALAAQNMVVAAEAMGLGTVYAGAIRNQPEDVIRELNLPAHVFPVFGLCVGYPDPAHPAQVKPRLAQRAVLHREQYSSDGRAQAVADYDAVMAGFYRAYRESGITWTELSLARLRGPETLAGRDKLVAALHRQKILLK